MVILHFLQKIEIAGTDSIHDVARRFYSRAVDVSLLCSARLLYQNLCMSPQMAHFVANRCHTPLTHYAENAKRFLAPVKLTQTTGWSAAQLFCIPLTIDHI
jgi:hypothetical protein